jgi:predicted ATPase/DNA-binding CsgD family transcriptional regulator
MSVGGDLPRRLTSFVGRDRELADLQRILSEDRLVTLIGPGGCGKTRLATAAADRLATRHPDGTWFVDLAPIMDPALVVGTVARAAGVRGGPIDELPGLVDRLHDHTALVLLDNCEHLLDAAAELAATVLAGCPNVRILVTSREALGVESERVMRVAPLGAEDSIRLFVDRARHADTGFRLHSGNQVAVSSICYRLDGLPLTIELAAALVGSMSPALILERLGERFRLLVGGPRSAVPRHRTLRATVEWSEALLSPAERRLFHRLSVFVGGFTAKAAEAIVADSELLSEEVLPLLRRLVERSLVQLGDDERPRYRLLETLREHALDRLVAEGGLEVLRDAHAAYFTEAAGGSLAESTIVTTTAGQWTYFNESTRGDDADLGNFRAALEHTRSTHSPLLPRLAIGMMPTWYSSLRLHEARQWLEDALATEPTDEAIRYRLLIELSHVCQRAGSLDASRRFRIAALATAERWANRQETAICLARLADIENDLGNHEAACDLAERALALARDVGGPEVLVPPLNILATLLHGTSERDRGLALAEEAVRAARQTPYPHFLEFTLSNLAFAYVLRGDFKAALAVQTEALRLEVIEAGTQLFGLTNMATVFVGLGQVDKAARLISAIEAECERAGLSFDTVVRDKAPLLQDALQSLRAGHTADRSPGDEISLDQARKYALEESYAPPAGPALSRRELQVALLVRQGLTNREIAARLFISTRTAEYHVESLRNKLGVRSRAEVAAWVAENSKEGT